MNPVMGELILTVSVIMVYSVSVGAVGGVWLTEDRKHWASFNLLLLREKLQTLNTAAAADKADRGAGAVIQNGAIETCRTSNQIQDSKQEMIMRKEKKQLNV